MEWSNNVACLDKPKNILHLDGEVAEKVATSPVVKSLTKTGRATSKASHGPPESESKQMPYDSLQVLSKRELIALVRLREIQFDEADLRSTCAAIMQRLKLLNARAREDKDVMQASEFARWVLQAGFHKLFHGQGRAAFEALQSDTIWACECAWKKSPLGPATEDVESTKEKLDKLLCVFSKAVQQPEALRLLQDASKSGLEKG